MIIRIFGNPDCLPNYENVMSIDYLNKYTPLNIRFTTDIDYTHALLINTCMPKLTIPKENVVGMAHEPIPYLKLTDAFIEYAKKHIGKYFIGDKVNLPEPFIENYTYMNHNKSPTLESYTAPDKSHFCSIIISDKMHAPGHKYRHTLVKAILRTSLPIDIYGCGCYLYKRYNDQRIKGPFEPNSVVPFKKYKYHICIENFVSNHYFSEKIINPLFTSTIPIYMGCRNIESYFPENVLYLSGNVKTDIAMLYDIIKNYQKYDKQIYINNAIKVTNIYNNLEKIFDEVIIKEEV